MPTFAQLGVSEDVLRAIDEIGYEEPTPIQAQTIEPFMAGHDVIAQAQTGTGKTAAFSIPIVDKIDTRTRGVQALVLTPTRELAVQVAEATYALGRFRNVHVLPVYGGQPISRQIRSLEKGSHVVVGTPGRVLDHLRRETMNLANVRMVVLDEADEMLDMGFIEDIEAILAQAPQERQTALFSATMPPEMVALSQRFMRDPVRVTIKAETATVANVVQTYYDVGRRNKVEALARILDYKEPTSAIIFTRTRVGAQELSDALESRGFAAEPLHGDMSQVQRDAVMRRFRDGRTELLVATDVAARGLDVEHVSHVINYDIPEAPDSYVHRVGRTARAGRTGEAITLISPRERRQLNYLERAIRSQIQRGHIPSAADVAMRRIQSLSQSIADEIAADGLAGFLELVDSLSADYDPIEIAAAALKMAADARGISLDVPPQEEEEEEPEPQRQPRRDRAAGPWDRDRDRGDRGDRVGTEQGMTRIFIDVGRKEGLRPQDIVGAIANEANIRGREIGAIDIYPHFTFVEIPSNAVRRVLDAMNRTTIKGLKVKANIARPRED